MWQVHGVVCRGRGRNAGPSDSAGMLRVWVLGKEQIRFSFQNLRPSSRNGRGGRAPSVQASGGSYASPGQLQLLKYHGTIRFPHFRFQIFIMVWNFEKLRKLVLNRACAMALIAIEKLSITIPDLQNVKISNLKRVGINAFGIHPSHECAAFDAIESAARGVRSGGAGAARARCGRGCGAGAARARCGNDAGAARARRGRGSGVARARRGRGAARARCGRDASVRRGRRTHPRLVGTLHS